MTILNILNEVAATSSKKEKQAILERNKTNEALQAVFKAAYDPTIKYYIKKIPDLNGDRYGTNNLFWALTELERLSDRLFTGHAAIDFVSDIRRGLSEDDDKVICAVLQRDLRIGCSESTANKVWKNLIPEYPYMRCALPKDAKFATWKWANGVYSQVKADGMFCNFDVAFDGNMMMTTRNGSEFDIEKFQMLVLDAKTLFLPGYRYNGELRVYRDGKVLPREISNGILNKIIKGGDWENPNDVVKYDVWDMIPLAQAVPGGKYEKAYQERYQALGELVDQHPECNIRMIETKIVYSLQEAYDHYFELIARGEEGSIVKKREGIWKDTTSKDQIKLKVVFECDLRIKALTDGKGKNEELFGSVTCVTEDELLEVNVSGFTDDMRQYIHDHFDELCDTIMAVKANNIMQPTAQNNMKWSLFSPRFAELRLDKTEADTLQRVKDQLAAVLANPTGVMNE